MYTGELYGLESKQVTGFFLAELNFRALILYSYLVS
jgi:hypothetical protein